jgi:hypothetical protein
LCSMLAMHRAHPVGYRDSGQRSQGWRRRSILLSCFESPPTVGRKRRASSKSAGCTRICRAKSCSNPLLLCPNPSRSIGRDASWVCTFRCHQHRCTWPAVDASGQTLWASPQRSCRVCVCPNPLLASRKLPAQLRTACTKHGGLMFNPIGGGLIFR